MSYYNKCKTVKLVLLYYRLMSYSQMLIYLLTI